MLSAVKRRPLVTVIGYRLFSCNLGRGYGPRVLYVESCGTRSRYKLLVSGLTACNKEFGTSSCVSCDDSRWNIVGPSGGQENSNTGMERAPLAFGDEGEAVSKDGLAVLSQTSTSADGGVAGDGRSVVNIETYLRVPHWPTCAGCGVFLQSETPSKPGFVPSHKYLEVAEVQRGSSALTCQKCFNLKHYNKVLDVAQPSNSDVAEFLSPLQRRKGLILYVVDVMNLPGSLVPELLDVVGETKRILIVGNKVDMLPVDGRFGKQEQLLKQAILRQCETHGLQHANIKGTCLISARTGFGMPQLLNLIRKHWDERGDVYLVGSVNSGKTTLFNLFLDLLNVHKKGDMLNRGTISLWPGTTGSVLRFALGHWMLVKLRRRLHEGYSRHKGKVVIDLDDVIIDQQETDYKDPEGIHREKLPVLPSPTAPTQEPTIHEPEFVSLEPEERQSWFYDIPGFINDQQVSHFLTMDELKLLNPTLWIVPRTFIMKPCQTLLLGGLGRVDFVEVRRLSWDGDEDAIPRANQSVYFTVMASPNLPVHVTSVSRADEVYEKHLGTEVLKVPQGNKERMAAFPKLKSCDFTITGTGWQKSASDLILSDVGWIAVTAGSGSKVTVRAYTPSGVGLGLREPALLASCVTQRGRRGAKQLGNSNPAAYESSRRRSPQLVKFLGQGHTGVYQWVSQAKKKRKEQRYLTKAEKMGRLVERSLGSGKLKSPREISGGSATEIEA